MICVSSTAHIFIHTMYIFSSAHLDIAIHVLNSFEIMFINIDQNVMSHFARQRHIV